MEDANIKSSATIGEFSILWYSTYKVQKSSTGSKVQGSKVQGCPKLKLTLNGEP